MQSPIEFYASASTANNARREQLWKDVRGGSSGSDTELKAALMQSLPGHSGYEPNAARRRLQSIANRNDGDRSALARVRIAELNTANDYRADMQQMQQRLDKIVDIERSLDGHASASDTAR